MQRFSLLNHILYVFKFECLVVIHLALTALTFHLHLSFHNAFGVHGFAFQSLQVGRSGVYTVAFQSLRIGRSGVYIVAFQSLRVGRSGVYIVAFQSLRPTAYQAFMEVLSHCLLTPILVLVFIIFLPLGG